jgi:hypothetical protein
MGHKITVSFSEDGADVTIKVEGMKGRGCLAATLELERALFGRQGGKGRVLTGEAYQAVTGADVLKAGR